MSKATLLRIRKDDSPLIRHAKQELKLADETDEIFLKGYLDMLKVFSDMGHSGYSGEFFLQVFNRLVRFENLKPLTDDPAEWIDRSDIGSDPRWQSRRCSEAFSNNAGKTYYLLSEIKQQGKTHTKTFHRSEPARK